MVDGPEEGGTAAVSDVGRTCSGTEESFDEMHDERNKEAFLQHLAQRLGRPRRRMADVRPLRFTSHPWDGRYDHKTQDDLVDLFCKTLQSQGGQVWRVQTHHAWQQRLAEWVQQKQVRRAVLWRDARLEALNLPELLAEAGVEWHFWQADESTGHRRWIELAKEAQLGITWADAALAETGTVVMFSGPGKGRSVSLVPEAHLVFVHRRQIQGRLSDLMPRLRQCHRQGQLPSSINFVSGPSSSADIEMQIVKGVHGPRELAAVVLDWDEAVDWKE